MEATYIGGSHIFFCTCISYATRLTSRPLKITRPCLCESPPSQVAKVAVMPDDASAVTEEFLAANGLAKDTPLVVFCRSGRRAGVAVGALAALGCTRAVNGMDTASLVCA